MGGLARRESVPRPRMIFVNSLSDLFHKKIPQAHIAAVKLDEFDRREIGYISGATRQPWGHVRELRKLAHCSGNGAAVDLLAYGEHSQGR
jgi:hypothetical protein